MKATWIHNVTHLPRFYIFLKFEQVLTHDMDTVPVKFEIDSFHYVYEQIQKY